MDKWHIHIMKYHSTVKGNDQEQIPSTWTKHNVEGKKRKLQKVQGYDTIL